MCDCTTYKRSQEPAFDKDALQQSVNLMAAAIQRVSALESALKDAINVIEIMKDGIGERCYRYSGTGQLVTWHTFALEKQTKLKNVLDQKK